MRKICFPTPWMPNDLTAEAAAIIAKSKSPLYQNTILFDALPKDLLNYLDRSELINEVFNQVFNLGGYDPILRLSFYFAYVLTDIQMQKLSGDYAGNLILEQMESLLFNINPDMGSTIEGMTKQTNLKDLSAKIQRNWAISNSQRQKQFIGDIVPNNTGISDRFGTGHDGSHIRSPKMGGNVITIEATKGTVIRQYLQELPSPDPLYGVWVLLRDGKVVVYKDLLTVDAKLRKLQLGKLYLAGLNPTSRVKVTASDLIGTIRPWHKDDTINKSDVGLHITFVYLKYILDYKEFLGLTSSQRERRKAYNFPLEKLIAPCSPESPVRCL